MLLCSWRKSRRTLAMVSTINIPGWLPKPSPGGSMEERCREWVPLGRRSARQPGPSSTPILSQWTEHIREIGQAALVGPSDKLAVAHLAKDEIRRVPCLDYGRQQGRQVEGRVEGEVDLL